MKIGFDAKRAFNNNTGLGHYSRTLITNLIKYFPQNDYVLFTPKVSNKFNQENTNNLTIVNPISFLSKLFKNIWRGNWVKKDLKQHQIDIYHGLSHQIPIGILKTKTKSVVTIHDLIFERYPEQHGKINVLLYRYKFKYACKNANAIIAISEQTKNDIIHFYKIPAEKIFVCYQTCNTIFMTNKSEVDINLVKQKYDLPNEYLLWVGSITERKNLLTVCKALKFGNVKTPLVVIGGGKKYKEIVKQFLVENNIQNQVLFLNENDAAKTDKFKNSDDFPAIYQGASLFIYSSIFEGFGIPILEALWSGVPVISSNVSCMPETGGNAAFYVAPFDEEAYANAIKNLLENKSLATYMIQKGYAHAQKFTDEICTQSVMNVYKKVLA